MTDLELFGKAMAHEHTGRFLFGCSFIPETFRRFRERYGLGEGLSMRDAFGTFEPHSVDLRKPGHELPRKDFSRYFKGVDIPEGAWIGQNGVLNVRGSAHHFTRYVSPLRDVTGVEGCYGFPFADNYGWTDDGMAEEVRRARGEGKVTLTWVGHQYEEAWQIRGYEEFLMDMACDPAIPFYILGRVHEYALHRVIAAARAGVDIIKTGDDVATQRALIMSPDMWRRFIKPLQRDLIETAHAINPDAKVWYHSDGDISAILPELVEMGVDILNPLQPECMDLDWVKREYGRRLVIDGTIGTQSTMPFGTPGDVRRAVAESKERYGYDGALIISPTHVLEPEVPPENVMAFLEECAKV
ncbi:MAG: hypothetical protein FWE70_04865 [Oscillospiraceae bacterium]|nr:hypothetical protein [Oscillospiraceae bacterium]